MKRLILFLIVFILSINVFAYRDAITPSSLLDLNPGSNLLNSNNVWTGNNIFWNISVFNYTGINVVNDSNYLQGMTPQEVADMYVETIYYAGTGLIKSTSTFSLDTNWLSARYYNKTQSDDRYLLSDGKKDYLAYYDTDSSLSATNNTVKVYFDSNGVLTFEG